MTTGKMDKRCLNQKHNMWEEETAINLSFNFSKQYAAYLTPFNNKSAGNAICKNINNIM